MRDVSVYVYMYVCMRVCDCMCVSSGLCNVVLQLIFVTVPRSGGWFDISIFLQGNNTCALADLITVTTPFIVEHHHKGEA